MNVKPILKYPGAKWALASWIVQYLPKTPHYVEPFCGSAAVFFNLPWRPKHAVLNDLSGDIVNLFRVIREDGERLAALIEMTPWAREEYERSYEVCEEPVERARRFLVRTWQGRRSGKWAYGPKYGGYGPDNINSPVERWIEAGPLVRAVSVCLRDAEIENKNALELVRQYAKYESDALIYADPPYVHDTRNTTDLYAHEMTDADHLALLDALDAHPGPVVLSGYRCALYDDRLPHWHTIETKAQAEKGNTRTEVLWLNEKAASARQLRMFDAA